MSATTTSFDLSYGLAPAGTLIQNFRGQIFRISAARRLKYLVVDEDGREWLIRFESAKLAPEGTKFSGPTETKTEAAAKEIPIGAVVKCVGKGSSRFNGKYLVVKRTSPSRFKLQEIGGSVSLTAPASMLALADG